MADMIIDTKGTNCPIPILKAKKAIGDLAVGGTMQILATDPGAVADFESYCRSTGHQLVEHSESAGVYTFLIKRMK